MDRIVDTDKSERGMGCVLRVWLAQTSRVGDVYKLLNKAPSFTWHPTSQDFSRCEAHYTLSQYPTRPNSLPRLSVCLSPTKGLLHCQSCGSSLLSVRKPSESKSIFFMIDFSLLCCSSGVSLTYSSTSSFGGSNTQRVKR